MKADVTKWVISLRGETLSSSITVKGSFEKALVELEELECEMPFEVIHVEMQRWKDPKGKK